MSHHPISHHIKLPKSDLGKRVKGVLNLIDTVHQDGALNHISLQFAATSQIGVLIIVDNHVRQLILAPKNDHLELTVTHEVGHFIEWAGIPKQQKSFRDFENDQLLRPWLEAVAASDGVQSWVEKLSSLATDSPVYEKIAYALRPNELWARSYSQYIATKSANQILLAQISQQRSTKPGTINYSLYWSREDFLPILEQIDLLFVSQGWK